MGKSGLLRLNFLANRSYSGYLMLGFRNLNFHLHALVPSRLGMEVQQSLANGLSHKSARFGFAMKLHLAFCRVNIDVNRSRSNFEKKATDRISAFHQRSVIPFEQGEIEAAIFHRSAINENVLVFPSGPR